SKKRASLRTFSGQSAARALVPTEVDGRARKLDGLADRREGELDVVSVLPPQPPVAHVLERVGEVERDLEGPCLRGHGHDLDVDAGQRHPLTQAHRRTPSEEAVEDGKEVIARQ